MARLVTQLLLVSIVFTIALPNPVPRREGKRHGHRRHRASTEASLLSTTGANTTDADYDYVATTPETASEADNDVTTEADYTDDDDEDVERSNSGSYPADSDSTLVHTILVPSILSTLILFRTHFIWLVHS